MESADQRIGRAGDDRTAPNPLPRFLVLPLIPQAGHHHVALVRHCNGVWLLLWLLPFIESVGDDEAPLALLPCVTKCARSSDGLGPRIDPSEANLAVPGPPRNKAPAHRLRDSLAVLAVNSHQRRIGRAYMPRRRNVWRGVARVKLQLDPGFRVIGREAHASTHVTDIRAQGWSQEGGAT